MSAIRVASERCGRLEAAVMNRLSGERLRKAIQADHATSNTVSVDGCAVKGREARSYWMQ